MTEDRNLLGELFASIPDDADEPTRLYMRAQYVIQDAFHALGDREVARGKPRWAMARWSKSSVRPWRCWSRAIGTSRPSATCASEWNSTPSMSEPLPTCSRTPRTLRRSIFSMSSGYGYRPRIDMA